MYNLTLSPLTAALYYRNASNRLSIKELGCLVDNCYLYYFFINFPVSAFVLQPERGSFQSPRTVTTESRAPCASNIWQKRQEKQQFLAELQPANQTDEELQLQIALELSKKQAEIDAQQR